MNRNRVLPGSLLFGSMFFTGAYLSLKQATAEEFNCCGTNSQCVQLNASYKCPMGNGNECVEQSSLYVYCCGTGGNHCAS